MARPHKPPHERRTASVRSDLTPAEKRLVQEQASRAGLSEAEYARRRMLGRVVRAAPTLRGVDPALVSELNRLGGEVSALGNVVNQVARACHTDRRLRPEWNDLPSLINDLRRRVQKAVEQLVLGDGP